MSYKAYEFRVADRAAFWAALQPFIGEIGWEEYDVIDADTIVYRSNGESGKEPYGYIHIDAGTSTYIEFTAYQYWNLATHTGVRKMWAYNTQSNSRITSFGGNNQSALLAGDKDLVVASTGHEYVSSQQTIIFGHLPYRFDTVLTNAEGTHGTAGTIWVASTSGLGVGKYVQIVGGTAGCDTTYITQMVDANNILVAALPRDYGTGSVLGSPASTFGIVAYGATPATRWHQTSFYGDAGTTVGSSYITITYISNPTISNYMGNFTKKFTLPPIIVATDSASSPGISLGMFGTNFMFANYTTQFEVYLRNNDGSTPEIGQVNRATATTLTDIGKSWNTNEHAGRFVIIITGQAVYQGGTYMMAGKIASNTADTLTVEANWQTTPDGSCYYVIADTLYRCMQVANVGPSTSVVRITDISVPS